MKKQRVLLSVAVILVVGVAFAVIQYRASRNAARAVGTKQSHRSAGDSMGVEAYANNSADLAKTVTVKGVVAGVEVHKHLLGLIDTQEYAACGGTSCAELILPVRWDGPMPPVRTTVYVAGRAESQGGKMVFIARSIRKLAAGGEAEK
ncbi:MAG: hypothetical protein ACP5VQ_09465 [Phycisphaerae bacterium]